MQQPQINPNDSSKRVKKNTRLPTFFINSEDRSTNYGAMLPGGDLSKDIINDVKTKVFKKIGKPEEGSSTICLATWEYGGCALCKSINSDFQTNDDSTPRVFQIGRSNDTSGFRGAEEENIIFHFNFITLDPPIFERFSRARKNLTVILSKPIRKCVQYNLIDELLRHDKICENPTCKENGWDKLKVIEVEYL